MNYYELKYLVTETFYENILEENYTIGQTAGRCFAEFYSQLKKNDLEALIVMSTILSRVAKHDNTALKLFEKDIKRMNLLFEKKDVLMNIENDTFVMLKDDIDYINSRNMI